jgi:hypothetical protein
VSSRGHDFRKQEQNPLRDTCARCGLVRRNDPFHSKNVFWGGRWQVVVPECRPRGQVHR